MSVHHLACYYSFLYASYQTAYAACPHLSLLYIDILHLWVGRQYIQTQLHHPTMIHLKMIAWRLLGQDPAGILKFKHFFMMLQPFQHNFSKWGHSCMNFFEMIFIEQSQWSHICSVVYPQLAIAQMLCYWEFRGNLNLFTSQAFIVKFGQNFVGWPVNLVSLMNPLVAH